MGIALNNSMDFLINKTISSIYVEFESKELILFLQITAN